MCGPRSGFRAPTGAAMDEFFALPVHTEPRGVIRISPTRGRPQCAGLSRGPSPKRPSRAAAVTASPRPQAPNRKPQTASPKPQAPNRKPQTASAQAPSHRRDRKPPPCRETSTRLAVGDREQMASGPRFRPGWAGRGPAPTSRRPRRTGGDPAGAVSAAHRAAAPRRAACTRLPGSMSFPAPGPKPPP